MKYAVNYEVSTDGVTVTFPDIPEAITCGDNLEDAKEMAVDALFTAFDFYFEDGRQVPAPTSNSVDWVEVPMSTEAKIHLLNGMVESRVSNADLARLIHVKPQEVTRIVNLNHNTKIDTIARALKAVGKDLRFEIA